MTVDHLPTVAGWVHHTLGTGNGPDSTGGKLPPPYSALGGPWPLVSAGLESIGGPSPPQLPKVCLSSCFKDLGVLWTWRPALKQQGSSVSTPALPP